MSNESKPKPSILADCDVEDFGNHIKVTEPQAREFWIKPNKEYHEFGRIFHVAHLCHEIGSDEIHVIEYSEYESLKLQAQALAEALNFYAKDQQFSCGTVMTGEQKRDMDDYGFTAREALAAYNQFLQGDEK